MPKSTFKDNGYGSLSAKRQRQIERAKSRSASKLNTPCGTPNRSRANSRRGSRRSSNRSGDCGRSRDSSLNVQSTHNGFLSTPGSAHASKRGSVRKAEKLKPISNKVGSSYLTLGRSQDDVLAVLNGLGVSRQGSYRDLGYGSQETGETSALQGTVSSFRVGKHRCPKVPRHGSDLSTIFIMDSSKDLMDIDPGTCYRTRPSPLRRQSSDLSCLTLEESPRQSGGEDDPDIQTVLDNLPILWEENKLSRWSQTDDDEMFKPSVSFKSLVMVATWCRKIRNRQCSDRRGSI